MKYTIDHNGFVTAKALVLGTATGLVCSVAFGFLYGFVVVLFLGRQSMLLHQVVGDAKAIVASTTAVLALLELACTVLGGCVSGLVAKRHEVLCGGLVGALGVVIGLLWPFQADPPPMLLQLGSLILTVPAGMAGGALANRYRDSATLVVRRLLFGLVWLVVFYYAGTIVVWGIAGGIAGIRLDAGPRSSVRFDLRTRISYGRFEGWQAVGKNINFIACGSFAAAFLGAGFGLLPGTRCRRQPDPLRAGPGQDT